MCAQGSRALAAAAQAEVSLPPQYGIPGRYAAALYMAAAKAGKLDAVERELAQLKALLADSREFSAFVGDPSLPAAARAEGLTAVLTKMGASEVTQRFVALVLDNNRAGDLGRMAGKYGEIAAEQRGEVRAVVTTAEALDRAEAAQIREGLKSLLRPGQSLALEEKVDPSIVAGLVIDVGDKHVDLSVLSRVRRLQQIIRDAV
jgi:F-type H+-transporting ATPase subunit O